jgi:hypothetical protein
MSTSNTNQDLSKIYKVNDRYGKIGDKNVWVEFTSLAREYNATNLGQVIIFSIS